jgi:hypothetical protein
MITFKEYLEEHIVKVDGKYRLVSKKTGKNLGAYPSKEGAEKRERQVQYFKHMGEENESGYIGTDKLTNTRKKLTPSEEIVTPEPLKDFETFEPIPVSITNK